MKLSANPSILLVEDDENDIVFMGDALARAGLGHTFQVARDGAEAIDYLSGEGAFSDRGCFPLPAVVYLDLKLPRVTGLEVLAWIRERPEMDATLVIMVTSSRRESDARRACELGANFYFVKPFNPIELDEIVRPVKRFWLPSEALSFTTSFPARLADAS